MTEDTHDLQPRHRAFFGIDLNRVARRPFAWRVPGRVAARSALLFLLVVVWQSPVPAQSAKDDPVAGESSPIVRGPDELLKYYTEKSVAGAGGESWLIGGVARSSLLQSYKREIVRSLAEHQKARGRDPDRMLFVLYNAYNSEVVLADGEDASVSPDEPYDFHRYLHQECYDKIDYDRDDVLLKQSANVDCYVDRISRYLSGDTLSFTAYTIWGTRLGDIKYWNPIVVPALVLTMIGLNLPPLAFYLILIWLLRDSLRDEPVGQRLLKVLGPIAIGLWWFLFWIFIVQSAGQFPGVLNSIKTWFWLSGIFFALNFIACMWIADHIFFPENLPPPWWVVLLFYLFGPFLLVLGGAAGSAAAGGGAAASSGSGPSPGSNTRSGKIGGGGGSFGGGGASGSF